MHAIYHYKNKINKRKMIQQLQKDFINHPHISINKSERQVLLKQLDVINDNVECPHTLDQILAYITHILCLPQIQEVWLLKRDV